MQASARLRSKGRVTIPQGVRDALDLHEGDLASRSGEIHIFAAGGRKLLTIAAGATFDSYPAISAGGTLLAGGDDGVLRAVG